MVARLPAQPSHHRHLRAYPTVVLASRSLTARGVRTSAGSRETQKGSRADGCSTELAEGCCRGGMARALAAGSRQLARLHHDRGRVLLARAFHGIARESVWLVAQRDHL